MSDGEKRSPATEVVEDRCGAAHRATVGRVIPWSGCVPAEPASVSPGAESVAWEGATGQDRLPSGSGKVIVVGRCVGGKAIGNSKLSLIGKNNCRLTPTPSANPSSVRDRDGNADAWGPDSPCRSRMAWH